MLLFTGAWFPLVRSLIAANGGHGSRLVPAAGRGRQAIACAVQDGRGAP